MSPNEAVQIAGDVLIPAYNAEKERLDRIDNWYRQKPDPPHQPRHSTREYKELASRSQTSWLSLVVTSVAQALYVEGYRQPTTDQDATPWTWWQQNGMDARQIALHRAALAYGIAYEAVLPGEDPLTGDAMPVMRGHSPRRFIALYEEPAWDDWPIYALQWDGKKTLRTYDSEAVYKFSIDSLGSTPVLLSVKEHNLGVCPVVRFTNSLDLEGRADGEVEPHIPEAARINQTTFDRLVVQRFSSWVVRTVSGMSRPDTSEALGETPEQTKLRLKVDDLLVAEDADAKFGSLPATPLDGFIKAHESDVRTLAAVTQTPAHELLGQMANLSAEALAAARASLTAKVVERQHTFGESHEQALRLAGHVMRDEEAARDVTAQVRWADTEIRSLAQAADALGKLATMLGVPVEVLWEKIPGWTDQDVERARAIVEEGDSITKLTQLLDKQAEPVPDAVPAE